MQQSAIEVASVFARSWEDAWNSRGAAAVAKLYTPDSVLIGAAIAVGPAEIERSLDRLIRLGWTRIGIKVVNARAVGGVVLVASEFSAVGSGANAGKLLNGRSGHVLTLVDDTWLSAMHSAA
jgi:ketosteroid isomerase-like protein